MKEKYTVITNNMKKRYFGEDIDKVIEYDRSQVKEIIVEQWINGICLCSVTMTPYEFFIENLGLEN